MWEGIHTAASAFKDRPAEHAFFDSVFLNYLQQPAPFRPANQILYTSPSPGDSSILQALTRRSLCQDTNSCKGSVIGDNESLSKAALPVVLLSALTLRSTESFKQAVLRFRADDVFCDDFMTGNLVVYGHGEDMPLSIPSNSNIRFLKHDPEVPSLPEGPYFLLGSQLHQAWKLYPDTLDSFATTIVAPSLTEPSR